ncbi:MAG: PExPT-CTERM protein [Nevskiales bacterium]
MTFRIEGIGLLGFCALLLAPDAFALQTLCQNSPENPTVVLGLIGAAAAGYPVARERARTFFKRKNRAARQEEQV